EILRRRMARIDDARFGEHEIDLLVEPGVDRDGRIAGRQDRHHRGGARGADAEVDRTRALRRRAGEVDGEPPAPLARRHLDAYRLILADAVVVEEAFRLGLAVAPPLQLGFQAARARGDQALHHFEHDVAAIFVAERSELVAADTRRAD